MICDPPEWHVMLERERTARFRQGFSAELEAGSKFPLQCPSSAVSPTCLAATSSSRPSPITTYVTFFPKRDTILSKQLSLPAKDNPPVRSLRQRETEPQQVPSSQYRNTSCPTGQGQHPVQLLRPEVEHSMGGSAAEMALHHVKIPAEPQQMAQFQTWHTPLPIFVAL